MLAQAAARAAEARSGAAGAAEKAKTVERVNHAMSYNHRIVKSLFNPRQRRGSASGRASKDAALAGAKWDIFFKKTLKNASFQLFSRSETLENMCNFTNSRTSQGVECALQCVGTRRVAGK